MTDSKTNIQFYLQPAFLICAVVLVMAGSGMAIAIKSFGVYMEKEPLPLKKSLELLDENGLGHYKIISKVKIKSDETVKSLGTKDYIQWVLEDTQAPQNSASRKFLLFITYYELPDIVPHVPEECYTGGGFQRLASDNVHFEINTEDSEKTIDGKYLVFSKTSASNWYTTARFPVLYFFQVNGQYAGNREDARFVLNKNLFQKSSYFCKVEFAFNQMPFEPKKEEAVKAGEKLLNVILPILEKQHWPDWEN